MSAFFGTRLLGLVFLAGGIRFSPGSEPLGVFTESLPELGIVTESLPEVGVVTESLPESTEFCVSVPPRVEGAFPFTEGIPLRSLSPRSPAVMGSSVSNGA